MVPVKIELRWGIPQGQRIPTARILYDAFEFNLRYFLGPRSKGVPFIASQLNEKFTLLALAENQVVGVAGVKSKEGGFLDIGIVSWLGTYHFWALRSLVVGFPFLLTMVTNSEMKVDSLAVTEKNRGQGIGTLLLNELIDYAINQGFLRLTLEVTYENVRGKILYERLGFKTTKSSAIPRPWSFLLGFSGVHRMECRVA